MHLPFCQAAEQAATEAEAAKDAAERDALAVKKRKRPDYNPPCIKCNRQFKCLDNLMVHEAKCLDGDKTVPCFEGTYVPWDGDEHYVPCYAGTFIPFFI